MPSVNRSNAKKRDQGYPATIDHLPDNVLIEIFDSYQGQFQDHRINAWHTLVHVCQRWRCLVFASPHRLNLQIRFTPERPMLMALKLWPALPIVIDFIFLRGLPQPAQAMANVNAALEHHNRVCKINISNMPDPLLKKFAAMKKPFEALTKLSIWSFDDPEDAPVLPDSFMVGSTPSLRSLWLAGISFLTVGKLLLSTSHLVDLGLWRIPNSGYISPEAMVTTLSTLTKLKKLVFGFHSFRFRGDEASRLPPPDTRVVLPALTSFIFKGDCEYLEDFISRIDAPLLEKAEITFFSQQMLDASLLCDFIVRTETLQAPHRAEVVFGALGAEITLFREQLEGTPNDEKFLLKLGISGTRSQSDRQLSALAQVSKSIMRPLHTLERLRIYEHHDSELRSWWQADTENAQWLELLRLFTHVKDIVLSPILVPFVAGALEELTGGRVTEVLPALQNLFIEGPRASGSVSNAIGKFIDARKLSSYPVTINYNE